jgi:hypothetical protein
VYELYVILEYELLLIPIISNGSRTATDNGYQHLDYQQWLICNDSETITDGSFESLKMTFSVVVVGFWLMKSGFSFDLCDGVDYLDKLKPYSKRVVNWLISGL